MSLPNEYNTIDFGFTAYDEKGLPVKKPAAPDAEEVMPKSHDRIETRLNVLQDKIEDVLAVLQSTPASSIALEIDMRRRLEGVEALIMPLLLNLLKTADKEYIKWPNREPQIRKTIEKLQELCQTSQSSASA